MFRFTQVSLGAIALVASAAVFAQKPIVYPAKGQTAEQQSKDDGECYAWAKGNTGVDPAVLAQAPAAPAQTGPTGARAKGAVRGAAAGAVVGEIANDDAGQGAKAGAAAGVIAGGSRNRQARRANEQQAQAHNQQQQDQMATFYKAHSACMEGRGYTVK